VLPYPTWAQAAAGASLSQTRAAGGHLLHAGAGGQAAGNPPQPPVGGPPLPLVGGVDAGAVGIGGDDAVDPPLPVGSSLPPVSSQPAAGAGMAMGG